MKVVFQIKIAIYANLATNLVKFLNFAYNSPRYPGRLFNDFPAKKTSRAWIEASGFSKIVTRFHACTHFGWIFCACVMDKHMKSSVYC